MVMGGMIVVFCGGDLVIWERVVLGALLNGGWDRMLSYFIN